MLIGRLRCLLLPWFTVHGFSETRVSAMPHGRTSTNSGHTRTLDRHILKIHPCSQTSRQALSPVHSISPLLIHCLWGTSLLRQRGRLRRSRFVVHRGEDRDPPLKRTLWAGVRRWKVLMAGGPSYHLSIKAALSERDLTFQQEVRDYQEAHGRSLKRCCP